MPFYKFNSIEEFDAWHDLVKSTLGLPYDDGITTQYTDPLIQADGSVIAYSDDEYAADLVTCNYTPPTFEYKTIEVQ